MLRRAVIPTPHKTATQSLFQAFFKMTFSLLPDLGYGWVMSGFCISCCWHFRTDFQNRRRCCRLPLYSNKLPRQFSDILAIISRGRRRQTQYGEYFQLILKLHFTLKICFILWNSRSTWCAYYRATDKQSIRSAALVRSEQILATSTTRCFLSQFR